MTTPWNPPPKKREDWSMWDTNTNEYRYAAGLPPKKESKWPKWPNPFSGIIKETDQWSCEHIQQNLIFFQSAALLNFWWTNFTPSPVEQTRHFVLGQYKCGWLWRPKLKSPIDVVWKNDKLSAVLLEIAGPFTKALYWWWATETAFAALDQAQTLIYQDEICEANGNECLVRDGNGTVPGTPGHRVGDPGLYTTMYDPRGHYPFGGAHIDNLEPSNVKANAVGRFEPAGCDFRNITMWIQAGDHEPIKQSFGDVLHGDIGSWNVSWSGALGIDPVSVRFEMDVEGFSVLPPTVWADRFTCKFSPYDPTQPDRTHDVPDDPLGPCAALWQQYYGEES